MPIVVSGSPKYKINIFKLSATKYKIQNAKSQIGLNIMENARHHLKGCIENVKPGLIFNASDLTLNVCSR